MFIFISVVSVCSVIRKINRAFPDFSRQGSVFRINFLQMFICGYHPDTFHFPGRTGYFPVIAASETYISASVAHNAVTSCISDRSVS